MSIERLEKALSFIMSQKTGREVKIEILRNDDHSKHEHVDCGLRAC